MSNNERNVDFIIRAKNQSKRTFEEVRKEIEAVNKVIDEQVEASKRGEGSLKSLDTAYRRLAEVTKDLTSQQKLVTQFQAQATRLTELEQKLTGATAKLRDHQAAMSASEAVTKRQEATSASLQKAVDRATEAVQRQNDRLASTRQQAEQLGIAMDNVDKAQDRLLSTARELVQANTSLSDSQQKFTENMKLAKREAEKLAETKAFEAQAAEAQRLVKASEYINWWTQALEEAERVERQVGETQAFQKKAAEAQKLVRAGEYINWWTKALDEMEERERQMSETQAFQKKAQEAQKLVKSAEYVNWWVQALDKAEEVEKRLADQSSLNQMADQALAAAQGYRTLGDASKRLAQNAKPLADVLRAINDPAAAARQTISGLEEEVNSLAQAVASGSGPIKNYREQVKALADAQKATVDLGIRVDDFQNQIAALRKTRAEFKAAQAAVSDYAQNMRTAGAPTAEMAADLKRLQANVEAAGQRLLNMRSRARESQVALKQAGIDTSKLANEQERLVRTAKTANQALGTLTQAYQRNGEAARTAAKTQGIFRDEGRTTLSLVQRIRGELLALAASYIGLQGAINLAAGALDAYNLKIGLRNQLTINPDIGMDTTKIDAEFEYLRDQVERVGLSFEALAPTYAKFSAAASLAGRDRDEIRYVAETFMEVGRVANLTADEIGGVFKALEQMYSKGKIQAEELRGQLGDRIFGAFEVFASALKEDFPDLNKAMEQGLVTSDYLIKAAIEYRSIVSDSLVGAVESLQANQARLNNEMLYFKEQIAEAGFAEEYSEFVEEMTEFLRSDAGQELATNISKAFGIVTDVLIWLLQNLDTVIATLKIFGIVIGTVQVARFAETIGAAIISLNDFGKAAEGSSKKVMALKWAMAGIQAFVIGWEIGKWAREKFEVVEWAGNRMVEQLLLAWVRIKYGFEIAFTEIEVFAQNIFNSLKQMINDWYNDALGIIDKVGRFTGLKALAPFANSLRIGEIDVSGPRDASEEIGVIRSDMETELNQIKQIFREMDDDMAARRRGTPQSGSGRTPTTTDVPDNIPNPADAVDLQAIKAASDAQIAASKRATDSILADLQRQEAEYSRLYQDSLITLDQYYAERARIATQRIDAEIGHLRDQIGALNAEVAETSADEIGRQNSIAEVQARIKQLTLDKVEAEKQFAAEARRAKEELSNQVRELENSVLELQGDRLQASLNRNQQSYEEMMKTAGKLSDSERERYVNNVELWKTLTDQESRLAEMNEYVQNMAEAAQAAAAYMDAMLDAKSYSGEYTDLEAMRAEGRINEEKLRQLTKLRDAYLQLGRDGAVAAAMIEAEMIKLSVRLDPIADMIRGKFEEAFGGFLENVILNRMSFIDAFRQLGFEIATEFAKMFIKEATQQLMKWFIEQGVFKFLSNMLMPQSNMVGTEIVAGGSGLFSSLFHTGGIVGEAGGLRRSNTSASWFAGAPRYHTGGIIGLKPDEYPAILQKNEEVLTAGDPRHIFNQGNGEASTAAVQDVSINNYVDAASFMSAALATQEGRKSIMNVLQAERTQLRSLVGR